MAFIECEFTRKLALMAVGGPGYSTSVNAGFSGYEQRNQNWAQARAQYNVTFQSKPVEEWQALEAMFHAARGQANGFRLLDPGDFRGVGEFIGTGDGTTTTFQLQKTYTFPISQYSVVRPVQKPITSLVVNYQGDFLTDTVNVYLDGALQASNPGYVPGGSADYSLDETTGVIIFTNPPDDDVVITADYQYHIPVRFSLDQMQKQFVTPANGSLLVTVSGIQLLEVRIKPGAAS